MGSTQVVELKVKVVSLMDEARRIRVEERKASKRRWVWVDEGDNRLRESLYLHRTRDIRPEARAALLAYGFLRGVPYRVMESKCRKPVDLKRLRSLVTKFGGLPDQPLKLADGELEAWLALQPTEVKGTS